MWVLYGGYALCMGKLACVGWKNGVICTLLSVVDRVFGEKL